MNDYHLYHSVSTVWMGATLHYDHETVRSLETHLKAVLWKSEIELSVVMAFKSSVKTYGTWLLTKCYFISVLLMWTRLHKSYNKLGAVRFWSVTVSQFCVRSTSLRWAWCKSCRTWNIIHCMPCRTPCRFLIHSNFRGPLGPQALV